MDINRLDQVWSQTSPADRIVLLGHDNSILTEEDKSNLAKILNAKANRAVNNKRNNHLRTPVRT